MSILSNRNKKIGAKPVQREAADQRALFHWAFLNRVKYPALENIFAIPNGGSRNLIEAHNLKLGGVKSGVPDIFLAWPQNGSQWPNEKGASGLFIELKAARGRVSPEQAEWIKKLNSVGYKAVVCYGFESSAILICDYLGIDSKTTGIYPVCKSPVQGL